MPPQHSHQGRTMTPNQLVVALNAHEGTLKGLNAAPEQFPSHQAKPTHEQALDHAMSMIVEMRGMLSKSGDEGRRTADETKTWEKLMRWWGFFQCILWFHAGIPMDALRDENR